MLLSAEQRLVLGAIELLLGGAATATSRERRLTDIDWALARHFFDRLLAQLTVIWDDVVGVELDARAARLAPRDRAAGRRRQRADAVDHDGGPARRRARRRSRC